MGNTTANNQPRPAAPLRVVAPASDGHIHDHDHDHDHDHEPAERPREATNIRPMAIALTITLVFMIVEIAGGLFTGSLALLADAGHMATDVVALGLSLFAIWLARRPATPRRSYGFARAEILATLFNATLLIVVSLYIFYEAWERWSDPPAVKSGAMLIVAIAGLAANALSAAVLWRGGGSEENLNVRSALLHVISDFLGSAAAIVAALVMMTTGWYQIDPLLSALIGLLVLRGAWNLLAESVNILLEATPEGMDAEAVRAAMTTVSGVSGVHDLHIWTVTSGLTALSAHVEIESDADWETILTAENRLLREQFQIAHATLQPELAGGGEPFRGCTLDTPTGVAACHASLNLPPLQPAAHAGHHH